MKATREEDACVFELALKDSGKSESYWTIWTEALAVDQKQDCKVKTAGPERCLMRQNVVFGYSDNAGH